MKQSLFKKRAFITSFIITLLLFASCKDAQPQTREEIREAKKIQSRKNLEQFFLGAIKLCSDATTANDHCCTNFVQSPYINPMEQYYYVFDQDRAIFDNRDNPFKLKEIREDMAGKIAKIKKKALSVDENNLVYEAYGGWSIDKYDFDKEELKINSYHAISFSGSYGHAPDRFEFQELMNFDSSIKMSSKEAEKIFDFYESIKTLRTGSMKHLNLRITYSLQKRAPEDQHKDEGFITKLKKVELFTLNGWSDKIGEFTF